MSADALADLRLDLRDLAGVVFVATAGDGEALEVQVVVDDPSVVTRVERSVADLTRRHGGVCVGLEVSVAGARRSELALEAELRGLEGVRQVELERGPRGELVRLSVGAASVATAAAVERFLERRLGRTVRERRVEVVVLAGV